MSVRTAATRSAMRGCRRTRPAGWPLISTSRKTRGLPGAYRSAASSARCAASPASASAAAAASKRAPLVHPTAAPSAWRRARRSARTRVAVQAARRRTGGRTTSCGRAGVACFLSQHSPNLRLPLEQPPSAAQNTHVLQPGRAAHAAQHAPASLTMWSGHVLQPARQPPRRVSARAPAAATPTHRRPTSRRRRRTRRARAPRGRCLAAARARRPKAAGRPTPRARTARPGCAAAAPRRPAAG